MNYVARFKALDSAASVIGVIAFLTALGGLVVGFALLYQTEEASIIAECVDRRVGACSETTRPYVVEGVAVIASSFVSAAFMWLASAWAAAWAAWAVGWEYTNRSQLPGD